MIVVTFSVLFVCSDMLCVFLCYCDPAVCMSICCFVFFKQSTAYELRISDWSSDVCSSDLAVAEDLVKTGVSAKGKIAISGRSNGGVLVGAAMTQRPDLYGAVISGSPIKDMWRYDKMLAGASWVAEYGDPDVPEDWALDRKSTRLNSSH